MVWTQEIEIRIITHDPNAIAPSWDTLQTIVRQTLQDDSGRFTRISRQDQSCNYRARGCYDVTYTPESGDDVRILFSVE
jgi:hypothetical protein